ncbi:MAG: DNA recombination protein RmuC [Comamonadaceae bacterium]|nr:DNA recombination protein RmuC [Comamonadaceae bacterium]
MQQHVDDIAAKYIIPGETSDGAVMFVPAESGVRRDPRLPPPSWWTTPCRQRVWIVSPTTLMAVLNTARAVLKDVETRKQIHHHQGRAGQARPRISPASTSACRTSREHIDQAGTRTCRTVQTTSRKISGHFFRIEQAQLDELPGDQPVAAIRGAAEA